MAQPKINLRVTRRVIAIRDRKPIRKNQIVAQARPEERIDAEASSQPQIGDTARRGYASFMIQMDVVAGNVIVLRKRKVELRRFDALPMGGLPCGIEVRGKILDRVVGGEFDAADQAV